MARIRLLIAVVTAPASAAAVMFAVALLAPAAAPATAPKAEAQAPSLHFGHSVEGRELVARRVGPAGGPRTMLVVGEVHGDEEAGRAVIRALRRERGRARGLTIWTVASVNPDGHAHDTRTNARGVDLNRNFPVAWSDRSPPGSLDYGGPRPLSEPESRAFRDLVRRLDPDITILYHQPWNAVLGPCSGPRPLQRRYARISGMSFDPCRGEGLPGTMTRWVNSRPGTAFVVEFGEHRPTDHAVSRHARAVRALAGG